MRKIYFDKITGKRLYDCKYNDSVIPATFDQDYESIIDLKIREKSTIGELVFENGEYEQDFLECGPNFQIDLITTKPLFSYPVPGEPEVQLVFQKPLSEEVKALKQENTLLKAQNQALTDRTDFHEELIVELAMVVYQ